MNPILSKDNSERSEELSYREIVMMMDIWYKGEWITMDDFTGHEWDDFENFESLVEREADDVDFMLACEEAMGLSEVIDYD